MNLRGSFPAVKCRAFHLASVAEKVWYIRLEKGEYQKLADFKRAFPEVLRYQQRKVRPCTVPPEHETTIWKVVEEISVPLYG